MGNLSMLLVIVMQRLTVPFTDIIPEPHTHSMLKCPETGSILLWCVSFWLCPLDDWHWLLFSKRLQLNDYGSLLLIVWCVLLKLERVLYYRHFCFLLIHGLWFIVPRFFLTACMIFYCNWMRLSAGKVELHVSKFGSVLLSLCGVT